MVLYYNPPNFHLWWCLVDPSFKPPSPPGPLTFLHLEDTSTALLLRLAFFTTGALSRASPTRILLSAISSSPLQELLSQLRSYPPIPTHQPRCLLVPFPPSPVLRSNRTIPRSPAMLPSAPKSSMSRTSLMITRVAATWSSNTVARTSKTS